MADEHKFDLTDLTELLAEAAWQRLRSLVLSLNRLENFVPLMPGVFVPPDRGDAPGAESSSADSRTLAEEFLLSNLAVIFAPEQAQVLLLMAAEPDASPAALAERLKISEMLLRERLSLLQQAVMVERNYETGTYALTVAGQAVAAFLQKLIQSTSQKIEQQLPELIETR